MQLVTKINLAMVLTFALGMAASSWYAYQLTQDNALRQVTDSVFGLRLDVVLCWLMRSFIPKQPCVCCYSSVKYFSGKTP